MIMPSIQVVIGLILIILFYSLLASILMELIANFLSLRGKHLERAIKSILSSSDRNEELFDDFLKSPLYLQLSGRGYGKKSAPSYLSSHSFREILFSTINNRNDGDNFLDKIKNLPDHNLKNVLEQFLIDTNFDTNAFEAKVETWYNDVMDRASGWYTRNTQKFLLILGLGMAVSFNVDTISIFDKLLNASSSDLEQLVAIAEQVNDQQTTTTDTETVEAMNKEIYGHIEENLASLKNPLGIGWSGFVPTPDLLFWGLKVLGWLITAICISKGSPFWFDLLNKVIRFRGTGKLPQEKVPQPESVVAVTSIPSSKIGSNQHNSDVEMLDKPVG